MATRYRSLKICRSLEQHGFLRREVVVHRRGRHVGSSGDVGNGDVVRGTIREQTHRCVDHRRPSRRAVGGSFHHIGLRTGVFFRIQPTTLEDKNYNPSTGVTQTISAQRDCRRRRERISPVKGSATQASTTLPAKQVLRLPQSTTTSRANPNSSRPRSVGSSPRSPASSSRRAPMRKRARPRRWPP